MLAVAGAIPVDAPQAEALTCLAHDVPALAAQGELLQPSGARQLRRKGLDIRPAVQHVATCS